MIRYRDTGYPTYAIKVILDGKYVGSIVRNGPRFWHYQPKGKGNPPGNSLSTPEQVKADIIGAGKQHFDNYAARV